MAIVKCPNCGKYLLEVNTKNGRMLVCQDRECGYRENLARLTNARCPECKKRLELRGVGDGKIYVCPGVKCNFREKASVFEKRFDKKIIAAGDAGGKIEYFEFANCQEENKYIVEEINRYRQDGVPYSDMAVIFRTNLGPRLLVEKLLEYNIPFHIKDALPNIYEHWIARDLFSYIKIALTNIYKWLWLSRSVTCDTVLRYTSKGARFTLIVLKPYIF